MAFAARADTVVIDVFAVRALLVPVGVQMWVGRMALVATDARTSTGQIFAMTGFAIVQGIVQTELAMTTVG